MRERKPRSLKWYDAPEEGIGIDGKLPNCGQCRELVDNRWLTEAVYSVSAETVEDPVDVARRAVERYHTRSHPAGEWGLAQSAGVWTLRLGRTGMVDSVVGLPALDGGPERLAVLLQSHRDVPRLTDIRRHSCSRDVIRAAC